MAEDDRKKKVLAEIASKVQPLADKACEAIDKASKELRGSIADIDNGVKNKEELEMLGTYQRDLKIDKRAVMEAALAIRDALNALDEVGADDEDFEAAQVEIKALKKKLTDKLLTVKTDLKDADDRDQQAKTYVSEVGGSEDTALKQWIGFNTVAERNESVKKKVLKDMEAWEVEAKQAADNHDAAALKKLQSAAPGPRDETALQGSLYKTMLANFSKKFKVAQFGKPFRARIAKETPALLAADKTQQTLAKQIEVIRERVNKLAVAPRDAKKAASLLKLPSGAVSKLATVLDMDTSKMGKALEDLGKANKVELDGKDAIATLKMGGIL
jgi:hypothetical protein